MVQRTVFNPAPQSNPALPHAATRTAIAGSSDDHFLIPLDLGYLTQYDYDYQIAK
jgi:hypothetical protein